MISEQELRRVAGRVGRQVPDGNLPTWGMVTAELRQLLTDFLTR